VPLPSLSQPGKYARVERERRFLLAGLPKDQPATAIRKITDRYLIGTALRLRHMADQRDGHHYKFTQKLPTDRPGPVQGLITNIYLSKAEYDLLAQLPGKVLIKTRYSVPPLGIDVFAPPLHGLVLAEAEFDTDKAMLAFQPPSYVSAEVTDDARFTGGRLVNTTREQLTSWLADYGIDAGLGEGPSNH
jgi:CYTH domain-containing protein